MVFRGVVSRRALLVVPLQAARIVQQGVYRSEANLVQVRFSAMRGRNFVTNLKAEDVVLAEDGRPQKIGLFEGPLSAWQEKQEVDFRISVDFSGSPEHFRPLTAELLSRTLIESIRRRAAVSLYAFAYDCRKLAGPTREQRELAGGVSRLNTVDLRQEFRRASRIYDSVIQIAGEIDPAATNSHPILVVFSDGINNGKKTANEAIEAALRAGMTVYPILLANPGGKDKRKYELIEEYAKFGPATGGRSFWPPVFTAEHIQRILEHIVIEVRAEYTVGYYRTPDEGKARARTVSVKLKERKQGRIQGGIRRVVM